LPKIARGLLSGLLCVGSRRPFCSHPAAQASLLHAAQLAAAQHDEKGQEPVVELLQQAAEAAIHGALRYKSAQLLVRSPLNLLLGPRFPMPPMSYCSLHCVQLGGKGLFGV
jgi:hypothetical protein